jgi:Protein of unknown function (DUF4435)
MKQFITPDVLANQVRMQRAAFAGSFVFVEGISDERFYSLFTDSNACKIIIAHGRLQVIAVCGILDQASFIGFVGITDADFDHAEGNSAPTGSVLLTDWHDAECFLVASDAFDRVLHEHADREKLANWKSTHGINNVREHFIKQGAEIGFLLWHSLSAGLGLNFNGLTIQSFVMPTTLVVDVNALTDHVLQLSGIPLIDKAQLTKEVTTKKSGGADLWQVTRGHDIVDLMCFALRGTWKPDPANLLSPKTMEAVLRTAYPTKAFASTRLYGLIRAWEASHGGQYLVLKQDL